LRTLITDMGGMVERQVALACNAVLDRDAEAATQAVEAGPKVDALDREAEQFVIRLLALRQPMAEDLRHIVSALKITAELERIGDYAKNVARRSIVLGQFGMTYPTPGLAHISRLVQENLRV
jgi:phosphate transport system protein